MPTKVLSAEMAFYEFLKLVGVKSDWLRELIKSFATQLRTKVIVNVHWNFWQVDKSILVEIHSIKMFFEFRSNKVVLSVHSG